MVLLLIGTGLFLLFVTKATIFRHFPIVMRYTVKTLFRKSPSQMCEGAISPFQAVCTALAATVGTGNIVGVALAIAVGGPGALFWLWVSALLGMVIKYCEVTLAVFYRTTNEKGELIGGPMYYITRGLGTKWLACLFSLFGFLASFGIGASVQSGSVTAGVTDVLDAPTWAIGFVVTVLAGLVLIGGIRRIATVTEVLVPFMAGFYIVGALIVLVINARAIPEVLLSVFQSAFNGTAATGGFLGATAALACRMGMTRGMFTHEAGMGSAPIAHASAVTDHPAKQGLWGAFEVFFDSIVVCTITGLVILTSGLWKTESQMNSGALSSAAFNQAFPGGRYIVTVGLILFAFATIIAWYYYGEKCVEFLFPHKMPAIRLYQVIYIIFVFLGCVADLNSIWRFADICNSLMAFPNLIALIGLSPDIYRLNKDFFLAQNEMRKGGWQ